MRLLCFVIGHDWRWVNRKIGSQKCARCERERINRNPKVTRLRVVAALVSTLAGIPATSSAQDVRIYTKDPVLGWKPQAPITAGGGGGGDGAILDGVSASIKGTVFDRTNSNPIATQAVDSNGDPLDDEMACRQAGSWTVSGSGTFLVGDGSGALTIDGTVTANQGGAPWSVSGSGTFTVGDGAGPLSVDGTVTANQGGAPWSFSQTVPTAILAGQHTVATGTATCLGSNAVRRIAVQSNFNNSAVIYVGPSGVTTANGREVYPGQEVTLETDNTNDLCFISGTASQTLSWSGS